jgi:hypothetical protein
VKLYRPVTVLVGVLFVLAGGLVRYADPNKFLEDPSRDVIHAVVGQTVAIDDGSVEVTRVKFAQTVVEHLEDKDEAPITTDGIFVAVEFDATTGAKKQLGQQAQLKGESGAVYEPISQVIRSSVDFPAPGFSKSSFLIFEVNPEDTVGLALYLKATSFWTVLVNDYEIDLGIPDRATADDLIAGAEKSYAFPTESTRVTS